MHTSTGILLILYIAINCALGFAGMVAERKKMKKITVNGNCYQWPTQPVIIICLDGGDPEYFKEPLAKGLIPAIKKMMKDGYSTIAHGVIPSFTNPNNISIITGTPPSGHGISGNYFLNPETGQEVMMNEPEFLRNETIPAAFSRQGAKVAVITAKDKLRLLLGHQVKDGITFSSEKADQCRREENGLDDGLAYVGRPLPEIYSAELSLFVLDAGLKILERERPDLMVLSLTDYIQHKYAPGTKEANDFYQAVDEALGRLLNAGAVIGLTADHGMNDKSNPDGSPKVIYLQEVLDQEIGPGKTRVILPITDPYVVHHGALGSFATVYFRHDLNPSPELINLITFLPGIEQVMPRQKAVEVFDLPGDRIGDLIVLADQTTVVGTRRTDHDLSLLQGGRLRSHGGLADRKVPFILSRPLNPEYTALAVSRQLYNYEIFNFALNGVR